MGSPGFDRTVFVKRQQQKERPPGPPLLGILLFVVVVVVVAAVGYKYIEANGMPELGDLGGSGNSANPTAAPDLTQIVTKLEQIEQRLERLEKRRASTPAAGENQPASANPALNPRPNELSTSSASGRRATSSKPLDPAEARRLAELQRKYGSLEAGVQADRERWDATTDRVTETVVELGEQRSELAGTRERVEQLWERFEREPIAFDLQKRSDKQRVGPLWLWLRKTDRKNHRYTMRVFADDKWIELKDRALLEPVELYLAEVPVPFELVITRIDDDEVSGVLGVPRQLPPR